MPLCLHDPTGGCFLSCHEWVGAIAFGGVAVQALWSGMKLAECVHRRQLGIPQQRSGSLLSLRDWPWSKGRATQTYLREPQHGPNKS